MRRRPEDWLPDVRDGLNRVERVILYQLHELQKEWGERHVPSAQLYGRVVEFVDLTPREFEAILSRLVGVRRGTGD